MAKRMEMKMVYDHDSDNDDSEADDHDDAMTATMMRQSGWRWAQRRG
jgi:hypothetical protein